MEPDISNRLNQLESSQKNIMGKLDELSRFLHEQADKTHKIREESIALQRKAIERAKRISAFAIPVLFLCVALIVYLLVKYRIL
ncbi:hypothetical protein KDK77_03130 [bacterium]|nr:hypothetical protein [bacterium]